MNVARTIAESMILAGTKVFVKAPNLELPSQYIEQLGWCQGNLFNLDGLFSQPQGVCAVGALTVWASRDILHRHRVFAHLYDAVRLHAGAEKNGVEKWNDSRERTKAEVLRAVRLAEHQILGVPAPEGWQLPAGPAPEGMPASCR